MANEDFLWEYSATDLVSGYERGEFSPIDALESIYERIGAVNARINAVVTTDDACARLMAQASAKRWQDNRPLSALDGVPITVKDNIPVAGMRATWGSKLYASYVPTLDELPVARLRAAGAIIIGKTNCPEFTVQGFTDNAVFGPTRNPFNLEMTPGGSSGGAVAAVAAGIAPIAIATDGGGSIRRPAAYTGLVGMKPSRGRVARTDGFANILHDCEVIGPIARTVGDVRRVMQIIGRPYFRDPLSVTLDDETYVASDPPPCRILYVPEFGASPVDPAIRQSVAGAVGVLASLGHTVKVGPVPFDVDALGQAWSTISQAGLAWLLNKHAGWTDLVSQGIQEMVASGSRLRAEQYYASLSELAVLKARLADVFDAYDLIMTPSTAAMPWPATQAFPQTIDSQTVGPRGHAIFTAFVNMSGCAALNLPSAAADDGMPIGFQLVGPVGTDGLLCNIGAQYESRSCTRRSWPAL